MKGRKINENWKGEIKMFDVIFANRMLRNGMGYAWPDVDISESADSYTFSFEIPGTLKNDIKVWIENNVLIVTGEKKSPRADNQKTLFSDRRYGKFERSFNLPERVDRNNVKADFVNGLLVVVIPKSLEAREKEISIN